MGTKFAPIGTIYGNDASGVEVEIRVAKAGRDYRLSHAGKDHLCHRSVRSPAETTREAGLAFGIFGGRFVAD